MPTPLPPDVVCARAVTSTTDTPYRAAGRGVTVVALSTSTAFQAALLRHWPRQMRVVVPTLEGAEPWLASASTFDGWLRNFTEALGLDCIALVADRRLASLASECLSHGPLRVYHLPLPLSEAHLDDATSALCGDASHISRLIAELAREIEGATHSPS